MKKLSASFLNGMAKQVALCAVMAAGLAFGFEAFAESHLIIHFNDGTATSFVVAQKPKLTFGETTLHVDAQELAADYPIANVKKFVFGDESAISNPRLEEKECRFTFVDRDHVTATGLQPGETITLTSTDGRQALRLNADANGCAEIELTSLPAGIYIVGAKSAQNIKIKH